MAKNGGKMGKLFYGESGKKNWEIPHFFTHFFNNFIYFNRVFLIKASGAFLLTIFHKNAINNWRKMGKMGNLF